MLAPFSSDVLTVTEIKQICEDFEEMHTCGRFIDADVTDRQGNPVSSGKAKLCFYCGRKPAALCRRENVHDLKELRVYMFSAMEKYCRQQRGEELCKKLSALALKSVLREISLSPKPGLVDRFENGSHTDMNFQTFIDSSAAIAVYFTDLAYEGFTFTGSDLSKGLPVVRNIGLRMETAMFSITNQVNTQKGIIFLMGLSLFACGYLFAHQETFSIEKFREIIKQVCRNISGRELANSESRPTTHGAEIYGRYRISGARGEAENGFPMGFDFGLPELLKGTQLDDTVLLRAFLSIAAHNNDTNILYRSNLEVLEKFKALCAAALEHSYAADLSDTAEYCKAKNISPGGSADLLGISIFIYFVRNISTDRLDLLKTNA